MILYTTGCPLCKTLERKMNQAGLSYTIIDDENDMIKLGFQSVPVLFAEDKYMNFSEAMKYIDTLMKEHIEPEKENTDEDQHQTG